MSYFHLQTVSEAFSRLGINDLSSDKTKNLATTSFDAMWGTMLAIKGASETKNVSDKLGKNTYFESQEVSKFLVKKLTELNFQGLTVRFTVLFLLFYFLFCEKGGGKMIELNLLQSIFVMIFSQ